jgi:glucosylceramidase
MLMLVRAVALLLALQVCSGVQVWETLLDASKLLYQLPSVNPVSGTSNNNLVVKINSQQYQEIYGFGASLTEASSYNLLNMKKANQGNYMQVLRNLFAPNTGAGFSIIRIPIGSCDMSMSPYFTYDDTPNDELFKNWTWNRDETYMLPVLQDILSINSKIQILISPWTAPTWQKTSAGASNAFYWGTLQDSMFDDFAYYFQVTIQKYQSQGIQIAALTLQNEPLNEPNSYPVMRLTPQNESFLAKTLGPKLSSNGIKTKILVYDHNWDVYTFPIQAMSDTSANQYIAGSAFHCYAGNVANQANVYNAYPNKEIWFTECSGTGPSNYNANIQWNTNNLYFGAIKNWARTVLHWNYATDSNYGPHSGGCSNCRGVITVQPNNVDVTYNEEFYGMAMFSKFLVFPAYRLDCSLSGSSCVSTMCIKNGDGSVLVVVANFCSSSQTVAVQNGGSYVQTSVNVGLTSFVW